MAEAKGIDGIGKTAYLPTLQHLKATTFYSSSFREANLEESRGRPYQVHISTVRDLGLLSLDCMTWKVAGYAFNGLIDRLEKRVARTSNADTSIGCGISPCNNHRDKRKGRTSSSRLHVNIAINPGQHPPVLLREYKSENLKPLPPRS